MRDWIIIAVLAGLAFLGLRQCGCVGSSPEAIAAEEQPGAADSSDPIKLELVADGGAVPRSALPGPDRALRDELEGVALRLLSGSDQAALDRAAAIAGSAQTEALRQLATAVQAAFGPDRIAAWRGLSRVHEAGLLRSRADDAVPAVPGIMARIEGLARRALRTPRLSVVYKVVPGDSLARIRHKVREQHSINVSPGMLRWLNDLRGDTIYPDQELRVPREPVELGVFMREFVLRVYVSGGLVREYPIGLGRDDRTPVETFVLKAPMEKAPWKDPVSGKIYHFGDPEYAIGTRWIGFEPKGPHGGLGIHGTNKPESIGKAESLGCIRLRNADVEALAELVAAGNLIRIVE